MNNEKKHYEEFNYFVKALSVVVTEYVWGLYRKLYYQKVPPKVLREIRTVARNIHSICEKTRLQILQNNLSRNREEGGNEND